MDVFVYGTLLYDDVVEALLGKVLKSDLAILDNYKRYKKEIPNGTSWGPAIIEEVDCKVQGRILYGLNERDLDIFDRFELSADDAYERIKCEVTLERDKNLRVFTYRAKERIRPYLKGEWPQTDFEELGLHHYVNERIPDLIKKWNIDTKSLNRITTQKNLKSKLPKPIII